jgi:lipoteichoic acid synthase
MLAGSDILSDSEGLVVFTSRSWRSDRGFYDRYTQTFTPAEGVTMTEEEQEAYVSAMKKLVGYKLDSTALIVETDFYRKAFGD